MPTIAARCPKCKTVFKLKDASLAGKKMRCRKCQTAFKIPSSSNGSRGGSGFDDHSGADPYGRDVAFTKPGVLPVGGRKIKKIQKVVEPEKPKAEEAEGPVYGERRRRKGEPKDKGKTKKKRKETSGKQKMIAIGGGVTLIVLIVVGAIFGPSLVKRISEAGKIEPPKNYVKFEANDSAVSFEYPEGWVTDHGGGTGGLPVFARVDYGNISISIKENQAASAMGEAAQAIANQDSNQYAPELKPVHGAHMRRQQVLMETLDNYTETGVQVFDCGFGDARLSKFEEKGTFSTTVGYRATIMAGKRTYFVTCSCRPSQFESAKPIFRRVLESIGLGKIPCSLATNVLCVSIYNWFQNPRTRRPHT